MTYYPPPSAGGGTTYTAGHGISIVSDEIQPTKRTTGAFWILPGPAANSTGAHAVTANQVRVFRFYLPIYMRVTSLVFRVAANAAGNCSFEVRNLAGTVLVTTGAVTTNTAGVRNIDVADADLDPDFYDLVWTSDTVSATFNSVAVDTSAFTDVLNAGTVNKGTAANASTAGVSPASLGTITSDATMQIPIVKLQG